eukprot:GAHX01002198.1.p1 GENE.GAHX01002198.1~~GAHX01002198.1.p1  ORF type:complete len:290 (-),score=22.86 GAHX01002198.1:99-968(-)
MQVYFLLFFAVAYTLPIALFLTVTRNSVFLIMSCLLGVLVTSSSLSAVLLTFKIFGISTMPPRFFWIVLETWSLYFLVGFIYSKLNDFRGKRLIQQNLWSNTLFVVLSYALGNTLIKTILFSTNSLELSLGMNSIFYTGCQLNNINMRLIKTVLFQVVNIMIITVNYQSISYDGRYQLFMNIIIFSILKDVLFVNKCFETSFNLLTLMTLAYLLFSFIDSAKEMFGRYFENEAEVRLKNTMLRQIHERLFGNTAGLIDLIVNENLNEGDILDDDNENSESSMSEDGDDD